MICKKKKSASCRLFLQRSRTVVRLTRRGCFSSMNRRCSSFWCCEDVIAHSLSSRWLSVSVYSCWTDKCCLLQFDAVRQDLWEDGAEAGSEGAVENRAEHHWEDNSSASAKWPECELCIIFKFSFILFLVWVWPLLVFFVISSICSVHTHTPHFLLIF